MQETLKTEQLSRVNLYALTSRILMNEVDEKLLKSIINDENMLSFFPSFKEWEKRKQLSDKDLIEKYFNVDFTNLFLLHLVPYESFYLRDDQMMETGGDNPVQALYIVELNRGVAAECHFYGVGIFHPYQVYRPLRKAGISKGGDGQHSPLLHETVKDATGGLFDHDVARVPHRYLADRILYRLFDLFLHGNVDSSLRFQTVCRVYLILWLGILEDK